MSKKEVALKPAPPQDAVVSDAGPLDPREAEILQGKASLLQNALFGIMAGEARPGEPCDEDEDMFAVWELAGELRAGFGRLLKHGFESSKAVSS